MTEYLKAGDVISGQEGVAKMTIKQPGGVTVVEDMFYVKNVEAKCEIKKTQIRTLGKRGDQNKPNGWSGTGNMTIYYVTSVFRKMALNYIKKGIPVYFDILITNNDPASTVGPQTTILKNCTLDNILLAKLDVESETLDESVDFTFDDADMLDEFSKPVLGTI